MYENLTVHFALSVLIFEYTYFSVLDAFGEPAVLVYFENVFGFALANLGASNDLFQENYYFGRFPGKLAFCPQQYKYLL